MSYLNFDIGMKYELDIFTEFTFSLFLSGLN